MGSGGRQGSGMKIAVFHPGTQHSWQTATALQDLGLLEFYLTSIFYRPDKWPYRIERYLPAAVRNRVHSEFRRFEHEALNPDLVKTSGLLEWLERLAARTGHRKLARRLDRLGNQRFVRHLENDIRSARPFALWGYNGSALESFAFARKYGRSRILDRTNGDFSILNRVMLEVMERYGDFFLPTHKQIPEPVLERDRAEYDLADRIVVGSDFAKQTLIEASPLTEAKTRVLNYCFDERLFSDAAPPKPVPRNEPVRFLFLGQLAPRKGIHHALEAIERIPPSQATLTLVGPMGMPPQTFARFADRVKCVPTVARADVPRIMAEHHVFLLPTYFEGAGIVLYEALASGLALIQSRNAALAATPDTGITLEKIDTAHLLTAMVALTEDRDRLDHYRANAQPEAENYTFSHYRTGIHDLLVEMQLI